MRKGNRKPHEATPPDYIMLSPSFTNIMQQSKVALPITQKATWALYMMLRYLFFHFFTDNSCFILNSAIIYFHA